MTSSLFDTFGSQNFPGNPSVPPGPPPGYTAPSSVANPASTSPPLTAAQISAAQAALQENNLSAVVQAVNGAVVPTSSSFDQLETWAQSLDNGAQNIENLVSTMLGIPTSAWDGVNAMLVDVEDWAKQLDGGIQQLLTWWDSLINGLLGGSGNNSVFDLTTWLQNAESNASAAWTQLEDFIATGNWSDLTAALNDYWLAIFGSSTASSLTGSIAAPSVANTTHQPQIVSDFPNSSSVQAGGGWSWDGTVSYSSSGGSVNATASGNALGLRGVVAPVQADQTVVLSSQVQWSGLTYTGSNPIQLQLIPGVLNTTTNVFTPGTPVEVAQITSPAASASWTALSGTYTVPSSGVTAVQMYLTVGPNATAGSVWWAACTTAISGGFLPTLQSDLNTLQADSAASTAAFGTLLTSWETAITGYTSWSTFITALETAWNTYTTTESGLLSSEIFTLQNLFNTLLGINTSTGLMSSSNVGSSTGAANLNADFSAILTPFESISGFTSTAAWNAAWAGVENLFGISTTALTATTSSSQIGSAKVASALGGGSASLGADVTTSSTTIVANADAVNQGITGTSGTGANSTAVTTAVSGLQTTVSGLQDQVSALQAPTGSPTTILSDTGQSSPGSGLGSSWTQNGAAAVNRDASTGFTWANSGSSARTCLGIYNTPLATNDQVGAISLNTLMTYDWFDPSNPTDWGAPYNQIVLRANAPTSPSSYVFARILYNTVQFGYAASGIENLLGSPVSFLACSAAGYQFYAGDASSDYNYALYSGGRVIASYADTAHASSASIAGRYPGQSWTSTPYSLGGETDPANTSWRAWDASSSAGTPLNYGHVTCIGTTPVTMTSGVLPYTFFDTTVALGSGISLPTSGDAGFVVANPGVYTFGFGLRPPSTPNATDLLTRILVNGSVVECGNYLTYDGGGTILYGMQMQQSSAGLLLNSGDLVSPSVADQAGTGAGGTWVGESTGSHCYMKIMKVG